MTILLDMNYAVISLPIELNLVCVRSTFLWAKFIMTIISSLEKLKNITNFRNSIEE